MRAVECAKSILEERFGMTKETIGASSQTVSRALAVLELLGQRGALGVREMARHFEVAPSIIQRLINSLAIAGFVEKAVENSKWKIGHKAYQVGSAFLSNTDLNAAVAPELRYLAEEKKINSFLGVEREGHIVYLAAVQSQGALSVTNSPGSRTYLHSTALGKAILADRSDSEAEELLGSAPYKQLTKKTKRSFAALLKDLKDCRRLGYAISDEENLDNVFSAGAPIRDANGITIAAISGAIPRQKLGQKTISEFCQLIKEAAARASRRLGAP